MRLLLNPFYIDIDPMLRLLLVNFEKDPDTLYVGFEPQVFDDAIHGKGHLIIGWRKDGKVDVYHEPTLKLNPAGYDIVGKGLANMVQCQMKEASFEVTNQGVQAYYLFTDIQNRQVRIKITESNPKKRAPFGLLAPMGDAAEHPSSMPLVLLHDFYFVRRKHTELEVTIDGVQHEADQLPMPIDMTKMYFTRYSPKPLIARLNPAFDGALHSVEVAEGATEVADNVHDLKLQWMGENLFISQITRKNDVHPVQLIFDDPFPNLYALENNANLSGRFRIHAHPSTGQIAGVYQVARKEETIKLSMIPSEGWKPVPTKFSLRLLYAVAGIFKKWPATYLWTANVLKNRDGYYTMVSGWKRIK